MHVNPRLALFFALVVGVSTTILADTLAGKVVGVADGDTITVLDGQQTQHKIRLMGIDAPEKAQPFGQNSKQSLSDLVFDRSVSVEWKKLDRYQRIVGKVQINGQDANLEQEFVKGLSAESKYFRFMNTIRELSQGQLIRLTQIDYDREMAFVATVEQDGEEVDDPYEEFTWLHQRCMVDFGRSGYRLK